MNTHFSQTNRRWAVVAVVVLLAAGLWAFSRLGPKDVPKGFTVGNGRLEAIEVDVSTRLAGRLMSLAPREGDRVKAGEVVAELDARDVQAQLQAAEATVRQARESSHEAQANIRAVASQLSLASHNLARAQALQRKGFISGAQVETQSTTQEGAAAGMAAAQDRVSGAVAATASAEARAESLRVNLDDTRLKAPITGRVLYRLAEPGEVLVSGGKVLTLLDLQQVYMTVYLPTQQVGLVPLQAEARILLDAMPNQALPARVIFVAPKAQFTPREVETRNEREKLMFRIKVQVDEAWLAAHQEMVKVGMPGVAYIRLDNSQAWPAQVAGK